MSFFFPGLLGKQFLTAAEAVLSCLQAIGCNKDPCLQESSECSKLFRHLAEVSKAIITLKDMSAAISQYKSQLDEALTNYVRWYETVKSDWGILKGVVLNELEVANKVINIYTFWKASFLFVSLYSNAVSGACIPNPGAVLHET